MKNIAYALWAAALVVGPVSAAEATSTFNRSETHLSDAAAPSLLNTLVTLCDTIVAAQVIDDGHNRGALICPSTNPQQHPLHSRAGEAVYPLAVAWQRTHVERYRNSALYLGRWLINIQQESGAWGESAPAHDGWTGTTADQLISLAGAYELLCSEMTESDRSRWRGAIMKAADYIVARFPMGPTNYWPTGAVALELAAKVVPGAPPAWREKGRALITATLGMVNADGLVTGEGGDHAVDLGYNMAQTIGYLGLYGRLTGNETLRDEAARRLRVHEVFVYPNGTVDNSWGTRSFKWTYESGTKTAPGVYFTFAVLADKDPTFGPAARKCLAYLVNTAIHDGRVTYGPHADRHASTHPPCLYGTFVRAQSLAMALTFAATAESRLSDVRFPAQVENWHRYFPSVRVAVVRTGKMMATVSAFGELGRFTRELVGRGGSLTNLWIEGFGPAGMAQTSSVTRYHRQEPPHMPNEGDLLPLTCRAECTIDGRYFTNLYETDARMTVAENPDHVAVSAGGYLRSASGEDSGVAFEIQHRFYTDRLEKTYTVKSSRRVTVRLVEPYVKEAGTLFAPVGARRVEIRAGKAVWAVEVRSTEPSVRLSSGVEQEKYWCPFPAVECHPLAVEVQVSPGETRRVEFALSPIERLDEGK